MTFRNALFATILMGCLLHWPEPQGVALVAQIQGLGAVDLVDEAAVRVAAVRVEIPPEGET